MFRDLKARLLSDMVKISEHRINLGTTNPDINETIMSGFRGMHMHQVFKRGSSFGTAIGEGALVGSGGPPRVGP